MDSDNFMLGVAIVAVAVALVGFTMTYNTLSPITGFATSTENGTINLTINQDLAINITHAGATLGDTLDFGSGRVDDGDPSAQLYSNGSTPINSTVDAFSTVSEGFRIQNIGNINVSLVNFSISDTFDAFYGTSGCIGAGNCNVTFNITSYNASLRNQNGLEACEVWVGNVNNTYVQLSTTPTTVCTDFPYYDFGIERDILRTDIGLQVPFDASPGAHGTIFVITFS